MKLGKALGDYDIQNKPTMTLILTIHSNNGQKC